MPVGPRTAARRSAPGRLVGRDDRHKRWESIDADALDTGHRLDRRHDAADEPAHAAGSAYSWSAMMRIETEWL
jgi:hypothetical protein